MKVGQIWSRQWDGVNVGYRVSRVERLGEFMVADLVPIKPGSGGWRLSFWTLPSPWWTLIEDVPSGC